MEEEASAKVQGAIVAEIQRKFSAAQRTSLPLFVERAKHWESSPVGEPPILSEAAELAKLLKEGVVPAAVVTVMKLRMRTKRTVEVKRSFPKFIVVMWGFLGLVLFRFKVMEKEKREYKEEIVLNNRKRTLDFFFIKSKIKE